MLVRCKAVTPRKAMQTKTRPVKNPDGSYRDQLYQQPMEFQYDRFDDSERFHGRTNQTLTTSIQMIRWWWQYLRVAVECEEREIEIDGLPVEVDYNFYKDWGLEEILYINFNDWFFGKDATRGKEGWKLGKDSHRHLFIEAGVKEMTRRQFGDEDFDDSYVYFKVPKNRYRSQVGKEIDAVLRPHLLEFGVDKRKDEFALSGVQTPLIHLHKRYNIVIQKLNGKSRKEIMKWINEKYDHISVAKQEGREKVYNKATKEVDLVDPYLEKQVISHEQGISREWVKGVKNIRRVAVGVFP